MGAGPHPGADAVAAAREIAYRLPDGPPGRVVVAAHLPDGEPSDRPFPLPSHRIGALLLDWARRGLSWQQTREELDLARDRLVETDGTAALRHAGIEVVRGQVSFLGRGQVAVGDEVVVPHRVVVASGSVPAVPDVPGILETGYRTGLDALDLERLPSSMVVLGAGSLGCELAQGFARLGVTVSLVDTAPRALPGADPQASEALEQALKADGVRLLLGATVAKVAPTLDGGAWVGTDVSGDVAAEALVVAAGRRARVAGLDLTAAGIATGGGGTVVVDDRLRTGAVDVYASGEVTGLAAYGASPGPMARVAAANVVARRPSLRWASPVAARVTRTDPEVVQLGTLDVDGANDDGATLGRAPGPTPDSVVTVLVGAPNGRGLLGLGGPAARSLLAATLVGPGASEAAGQLVLAVNAGLPAASLIDTAAADGSWAAAIQVAVAQALVARY